MIKATTRHRESSSASHPLTSYPSDFPPFCWVVGQIMSLTPRYPHPNLQNLWICVPWTAKATLPKWVNEGFEMGCYSGSSGSIHQIVRSLLEGERSRVRETEVGRCSRAGFEAGGKNYKLRNANSLWELEKARKQLLPPEPPGGTQLSWWVDLAPVRLVLDLGSSELGDGTSVLCLAMKFVEICYR